MSRRLRLPGSDRLGAALACGLVLAAAGVWGPSASGHPHGAIVGPRTGLYGNGRLLRPVGHQTKVGDFPSGGALSPNGRFYWAIDSGQGIDDAQIVSVATGHVIQRLPLPGAYFGAAFAPDGRHAYVSGEPQGCCGKTGPTKGKDGDVIHVYRVNRRTGRAREQKPIPIPPSSGGSYRRNTLPPESDANAWPEGLAVSPDGGTLVAVLGNADRVAIVDLKTGAARLAPVGAYPYGVAIDPHRPLAYVSNEYDGTVSVVDTKSGGTVATIGVGGPAGDRGAHPEGMVTDPRRHRLYVAVTNRDLVAVVDTKSMRVLHYVDVGHPAGTGTAPVALALAPDGRTLYTADAGEDAVAAIALQRGGAGSSSAAKSFSVIGRIPTAAYTSGVAVTPNGRRLIWLAAKGLGAGPNPDYGQHFADSGAAPYGSYVPQMLLGRVGVLHRPTTDRRLRRLSRRAHRQLIPTNHSAPPRGTPVVGPNGGSSKKIHYVFYVVRENRTYDQIFGSDSRGDGDPKLEVFDGNGASGPAGGVTPNAHRLVRQFPLLDHVYADSEVSVDGHLITSGGYATDYAQKGLHPGYSGRGKGDDVGIFPVSFPPKGFIFDQAARQGVTFRSYGEVGAGNQPFGNDGRPTFGQVIANTDTAYPTNLQIGCQTALPPPNLTRCAEDSGSVAGTGQRTSLESRIDVFRSEFDSQLAAGTVPQFNYLILPNDHTNGTTPGVYTPKALVADNDLALGQLVDIISHSPIWRQSAIFVVEDDSQDGADHVDAHRMPAFVISPWARRGAVVSTRYDQYSFLRTAELILGLKPLSLNDALATPLYRAFISAHQRPDVNGTRYTAVEPKQSLTQTNSATAPDAKMSAALPWDKIDSVPQALSDRILWHSVYGERSRPPSPGPDFSPEEQARAVGALRVFRRGGNVRSWLLSHHQSELQIAKDASRIRDRTFALSHHVSAREARQRIGRIDRSDLRRTAAR
jgi:YVTN family beta-propeller protein